MAITPDRVREIFRVPTVRRLKWKEPRQGGTLHVEKEQVLHHARAGRRIVVSLRFGAGLRAN